MSAETPDHFSSFAKSLSSRLARYELDPEMSREERNEALLIIQRDQITRLLALETRFRELLVSAGIARDVYQRFIKMIRQQRRNILAARSFFRERQTVFTGDDCTCRPSRRADCQRCFGLGKTGISAAIAAENIPALLSFHPNIQFVQFALRVRRWSVESEAQLLRFSWWKPAPRRKQLAAPVRGETEMMQVVQDLFALRNELVESNLPLVIERALLFGRRTPPSHLSRMDLVQIAADGLMAGVDKLVLEVRVRGGTTAWDGTSDPDDANFTKEPGSVFRGVAIGRMVGNLIEQYSATMVHFFPGDKRKIYRANKAGRFAPKEDLDFERVADEVNTDPKCKVCKGKKPQNCQVCGGSGKGGPVPDNQKTTAAEIVDLMGAASCVSLVDDEGIDHIAKFADDETRRPDVQVERYEAATQLQSAMAKLPLFERKFLALRGISIEL